MLKRIFDFQGRRGRLPKGPFNVLRRIGSVAVNVEESRYQIRSKDLGKLHRAASKGKVARVEHILSLGENDLNDKDKMNRTALHLACANGHVEVVTLLVRGKCELNLRDNEERTPLLKAIQCRQEDCALILLESGANPNVRDISGNSPLHYAACGSCMTTAAQLLLCNADIEARNKHGLTPLLLAISKNNDQMVEFLISKGANIHVIDEDKRTALMFAVINGSTNTVKLLLQRDIDVKSRDIYEFTAREYAVVHGFDNICQLISKYSEENKAKNSSQNFQTSAPGKKLSEEDSLKKSGGQSSKSTEDTHGDEASFKISGIDDSFPESTDEDFDFDEKNMQKPNLKELMDTFLQSKKEEKETKCHIVKPGKRANSQGFSHEKSAVKPSLKSSAGLGLTKKGSVQTVVGEEESCSNTIERVQKEKINNDDLTSHEAHKSNRSNKMSALGLEEEEDTESPWDSESLPESLPQKNVGHFSGSPGQRGENLLNKQVGELLDVERTAKEEQEKLGGSAFNHPQISDSHEKEDLLHEHRMLQDEIARLRIEVDTIKQSHHSIISTPVHDHEQSQASGRKLELALQRQREEWFCFRDKINFAMSNLKEENEILSQQLSKAVGKFSSLETELCHTRDALRENTSVLEHVQRDLSHTQCQKKEIEHRYQKKQEKLNKYITKQESLEERLSKLQTENELLRQQLSEAQNKAENKEKTLIDIQNRFMEIIKNLQTKNEKCLLLKESNELVNDCNHLKERLNQCESEKGEREVGNLTTALEISSSECLPAVTRNQVEQMLLSMTSLQKKCEKLEKTTKKLEQEIVNLKTHMVQTSSQEKVEQLRANDNASLRREMELRIQELESELSKKTDKENLMKTKLEKYQQLYLEEVKFSKSILANRVNDLHMTTEIPEEINTRCFVEKQQNGSSISSLTMRPVLEPPSVGILKGSVISRHHSPRENLVIPTCSQQISSDRMVTYFLKVQRKLEKRITRELEEATAELESGAWTAATTLSYGLH
ncbi:putative ankyrin repeat domain-containing protein 20A2 isoform X3 [Manis pentadactyla]|uniref:putative ankyrin repeat domain-containing protein 20A2 isoform X3 n=1 Tax=Manis pentadactyla TaxID=143292 RepID=UPI00255C6E56|nr:putative ankyrin repeat domain-containing protein 20A2 isoform X3 [Manis pentadactyla]